MACRSRGQTDVTAVVETLNHPARDFRSTEGALSAGPRLQHSGNRSAPARWQQGHGIQNPQFVYAFGPT